MRRLTPVFQERYSQVGQLVCAWFQRKVGAGNIEQKDDRASCR